MIWLIDWFFPCKYLPKAMDGPLLYILWYLANVFLVDILWNSSMCRVERWKYRLHTIIFKMSIKERTCQCSVINTRLHICSELDHFSSLYWTHQTEASRPLQCEEHASPVTRSAHGHVELKTLLENILYISLISCMVLQTVLRNILDVNHFQTALLLYNPHSVTPLSDAPPLD